MVGLDLATAFDPREGESSHRTWCCAFVVRGMHKEQQDYWHHVEASCTSLAIFETNPYEQEQFAVLEGQWLPPWCDLSWYKMPCLHAFIFPLYPILPRTDDNPHP